MGFLEKIKNRFDFDEYDDYDELFDEDDDYVDSFSTKTNKTKSMESKFRGEKQNDTEEIGGRKLFIGRKITPLEQKKVAPDVCILKPKSYNDSVDISDALINGRAVVLNLENLTSDVAQIIVDFVTGACVVLDGSFKSISNHVFVITPNNIDIDGGMEDLLLNNFGIEK